MKCLERLLRYMNYYHYDKETQGVKLDIGEGYYLIINHYTKSGQIVSEKQLIQNKHRDRKLDTIEEEKKEN